MARLISTGTLDIGTDAIELKKMAQEFADYTERFIDRYGNANINGKSVKALFNMEAKDSAFITDDNLEKIVCLLDTIVDCMEEYQRVEADITSHAADFV